MGEPRLRMDPASYLAFEREASEKHELWDGEVYAMGGASLAHNWIVANLIANLNPRLADSSCKALPSDMRVYVPARASYVYPDVTLVCGRPELDGGDVLINPRAVFEVLSPSTAAFDRGDKFAGYRSVASLREVVFVSQHVAQVECYVRQADGSWLLRALGAGEALALDLLTTPLPVADIYAGVF